MVNSKDHRVVVIESILCPANFRNTLAKVLFHHLNVCTCMCFSLRNGWWPKPLISFVRVYINKPEQ